MYSLQGLLFHRFRCNGVQKLVDVATVETATNTGKFMGRYGHYRLTLTSYEPSSSTDWLIWWQAPMLPFDGRRITYLTRDTLYYPSEEEVNRDLAIFQSKQERLRYIRHKLVVSMRESE